MVYSNVCGIQELRVAVSNSDEGVENHTSLLHGQRCNMASRQLVTFVGHFHS